VGLLTTTVGWFPKPPALRRARWQFAEGEIAEGPLREAESAARSAAIAQQESLGLDLLVDGQLERSDMITHFAERLAGLEIAGWVRCFDNRYYRKPRIVADVRHAGPITVEAWQAARAATSKPLKAVITGPYTMMDWSFDEHYASREACCMALAAAIRAEAEALLAAGAEEIEIDEPAISARPEEIDLACRALAHVTEPLRGKARSWTHVSYGEWEPVLDGLLRLPVDGLLLELTQSGHRVLPQLAALPADKQLGLGVVDVLSEEVESSAAIRTRVERALRYVPAERLWLIPDGGLRCLSAQAAQDKLARLVEVAASF